MCESLRTVVYTPFYLCLAGGFFAHEGLAVEHVLAPQGPLAAQWVLDGRMDVAWGGPMRVMMYHDADAASPLSCFGQVVARDPFLLVGRTPNAAFQWRDLLGLRVGVATDVPTSWMTFQDDLQRAGIDPAQVKRLPDRPMAHNVAAFTRGELDVVQVLEPYADQLVASRTGHVWHRFSSRGDIGYTTFITSRRFATEQREACRRLTRALAAAQAALHAWSIETVAESIHSYFAEMSVAQLARILEGYRNAHLWARSPALPLAAFLRLKAALVSGGHIGSDIPYERVIDVELSNTGQTPKRGSP
jgi:NitT/TauT family transport system substrate-binding protein